MNADGSGGVRYWAADSGCGPEHPVSVYSQSDKPPSLIPAQCKGLRSGEQSRGIQEVVFDKKLSTLLTSCLFTY